MKKTIVTLIAVSTLIGCSKFPSKIGEKMPAVNSQNVLEMGPWRNEDNSKKGFSLLLDEDGDGIHDLKAAYLECNKKIFEHPLGVYDGKNNILYLDKNFDGLVDEIIENPEKEKKIYNDAPDCNSII